MEKAMFRRLLALSLLLPLGASSAGAQFNDLAELIPDIFSETVILREAGHQAHFVDASTGLREAGLQINRSIVRQLSTFPVGSSSGGFTFEFNEELGIFERSTSTFGSVFAERGETIGKGKWNFGVSAFALDYDAIDDLGLADGDLEFSLTHLDTNADGTTIETFFEGDLILVETALSLETQTTVFFGSYGLSERFDLAVAVPLIEVDLSARLARHISRLASEGRDEVPLHLFSDGEDQQIAQASGSESGVGDVLVRAKYNFTRNDNGALAAAVDVRLPTGDEKNLLGAGATQTKVFLIGSSNFGRFSPHVNLGYTFSSGSSDLVGELSDEINFTTGASIAANPRVTFFADLVWRTLLDATKLQRRELTHLYRRFDSTEVQSTTRPSIEGVEDDLNLILGSVGVKVNFVKELLVSLNLGFALGEDGLRDEDIVPMLSLDYSF
jgi:hypothetical protein